MVGQTHLLEQIKWMCKANCFPRFAIIVGDNGKQEKQLAHNVATQMNAFYVELADNKIDSVREMIEHSYKVSNQTVYVIPSGDDMSIPAKNALLKVTEEPPNKASFIMLLNDINNTLDTIKSRATIFTMEPYRKQELLDYTMETYKENSEIYTDWCSTPDEIDLLYKMGAEDFVEYVKKVVDNIDTVNGANSFKIADKVAIKDENGYDLKMFWKACCRFFRNKYFEGFGISYMPAFRETSNAIKKLSIRGVNKQMLFDEWLLNVREVLR